MRKKLWLCLAVLMAAYAFQPTVAFAGFMQFNLISDLPTMAPVTDPNLKNPWGMSFSAKSPFWVSNQGTGTSTLYSALPAPSIVPLVVSILPAGGPGPTGQVFNSTVSDFQIPAASGTVQSKFLFDTLDGNIEGWNPGSTGGPGLAVIAKAIPGAVFTGLALGAVGSTNYLYAADASGQIRVFDGSFTDVTGTTFAGKFVDPNPVAPFTPYGIQNLGGDLFVTYATLGSSGGYVDEFDSSGTFIKRIATGGPIDGPWGLAIAPPGFGPFAGDLLVGNLNDSMINAFNLTTDALDGSISVSTGFPSPAGLWAIAPGNGITGSANALYFTSGINNQSDGLFGVIAFVPEPGSFGILAVGVAAFAGYGWRRRMARG
jgi:uncharacterized protein (TIGR03118 family)